MTFEDHFGRVASYEARRSLGTGYPFNHARMWYVLTDRMTEENWRSYQEELQRVSPVPPSQQGE